MEVKGISLCYPRPPESCGQQTDPRQQGIFGAPRQDWRQRGYNGEKWQEAGNLVPNEHGTNQRHLQYYNQERGYDREVESRQQSYRQIHDGNQRRYDSDEHRLGHDRSQWNFTRDGVNGEFVQNEDNRGFYQQGNDHEFHRDRNFREFPPEEHGRGHAESDKRTQIFPDGHEGNFVEDRIQRQGFLHIGNSSTHSIRSDLQGRRPRGYGQPTIQEGYAGETNVEQSQYVGDSRDKTHPHYRSPSQYASLTAGQGHERQDFAEQNQGGRWHQNVPTVERGVHYEQQQRLFDASQHSFLVDPLSRGKVEKTSQASICLCMYLE